MRLISQSEFLNRILCPAKTSYLALLNVYGEENPLTKAGKAYIETLGEFHTSLGTPIEKKVKRK